VSGFCFTQKKYQKGPVVFCKEHQCALGGIPDKSTAEPLKKAESGRERVVLEKNIGPLHFANDSAVLVLGGKAIGTLPAM